MDYGGSVQDSVLYLGYSIYKVTLFYTSYASIHTGTFTPSYSFQLYILVLEQIETKDFELYCYRALPFCDYSALSP